MNKIRTCLRRAVSSSSDLTLSALRCLAIMAMVLALASCDDLLPTGGSHKTQNPADSIKVGKLKHDPAYKHYTMDVCIPSDSSAIFLEARPHLRLDVKTLFHGEEADSLTAFSLDKIENLATEYISNNDVTVQMVVDLTLSDSLVAEEREIAIHLADLVKDDHNMYVSFFDGDGLSETFPLTQYVLDTHFKRSEATARKKTYRTLLAELQRMTDAAEFTYLPNTPRNTQWDNLKKGTRYLLFCSDGQTYNRYNLPLDNHHYELKSELLTAADENQ